MSSNTNNLVIVESPAKAKTIEKYLGVGFKVLSSVGHIRSIAKKTKDGKDAIDVANNFETVYEIDPEKRKVIAELKKAIKSSNEVWLATDEDREGEAIAWHLCEVLKLDSAKTKRIVFHEITKDAIENAIENPRTIDMSLVRAQQARQILDRIVGFELSPVVWKKVPGGKSAGRVQSPAVRLLVEREAEIDDFDSKFDFKITAEFSHEGETLKAELPNHFDTEEQANDFLESLKDATFTVSSVNKSPGTRSPSTPYTTSTLQQDANARLGFGTRATMSAAQKLYQAGKITYMRTDSVNLSSQALGQMTSYIKKEFGDNYHQYRTFKTKSSGAQEAHEAIRPTDISIISASNDPYEQKLYELIRNRTLASQMTPAKLERTKITINITPGSEVFESKGEVITFDGFLKVYGGSKKDPDVLPLLTTNDKLSLEQALAKQTFIRPPARYSEGSLVKKLEELGIGRPSTYATIINTVLVRGYAEKGDSEGEERDIAVLSLKNSNLSREVVQEKTGSNKGKLVPTASGKVLNDFLVNHFDQVVDYKFTANVETEFDQIATNKLDRNKMLANFYTPFHNLIKNSDSIDRSKVAQAREIGTDPKSGKPILARFGRFGPMLQLGNSEDKDNKPQFAPLPKGTKLETVTLNQAIKAFELPRFVGQTDDGQDIKANIGRFGPYIQINKLFVSIKPEDPHTITLDKARELYADKLKKESEKNIANFGDIKILKGRFGPYITDGIKNAKVPKDIDPQTINEAQAKELLSKAPVKKSTKISRKPTPRKRKSQSK